MKKSIYFILIALFTITYSCQPDQEDLSATQVKVPGDIVSKLKKAGFDTSEGLVKYKDGYLVEYDIFLTEKQIDALAEANKAAPKNARVEHYRTNNLITGLPRTLSVFMDTGFGTYMQNAFDLAIARYNNVNLGLKFQRTTNQAGASISILSFYEVSNVLGFSAGFPSGGNPASPIKLNTYYYNNTSQRADAATVIAHEIGHAIGFRHTDFMNRAFSCGSGGNEGDAGVGAVQIPGTPSTPSAGSWMLACSNNTDRPFTSADVVALSTLYGGTKFYLNLFAIKKSATGTSSTEVHVLGGQSAFASFILQTGTALHETGDNFDFLISDFNRDGSKDLVAIKKSSTGSGTTEIHILNGADNYQSFILQTGTALHETGSNFDFVMGDYNRDGVDDIYAIKKSSTGSNSTEVHVLNGANNFGSFILQTGTSLGETDGTFEFVLGDYNRDGYQDIYAIKKSSTGSSSTELHVLNGASNFGNFILQTGTVLGETGDNFEFDAGDANNDSYVDIIAIKKSSTGSGRTEVHILNGQNNYQGFLAQLATGLSETDTNFKLLAK